jgi:predicted nucleotidyltransferase
MAATPGRRHYDGIPREARAPVDALVKELHKTLGDGLVSVIVHGSAVRGDFRAGESDMDVVLVLSAPTRATLTRISSTLTLARAEGGVEAMIVTAEEIARAADVFPLFYEDIKKAHVLVFGSDPFAELEIRDVHRRLRIEQELREAQIRLRAEITRARGDDHAIALAVARKLRQIRFPMRALLEMLGVECESHALEIVLQKACKQFKTPAAHLLRPEKKPNEAHDALTALLGRAIDVVDHLDVREGERAVSA